MASSASWCLALWVAFGSAVACGNTEHGQPTTQSGGSAGAGADGLSSVGATGQSTGGAGPSDHAGAPSKAGSATGGTAVGGRSGNGGAAGLTEGGVAGVAEGGAAGASEGGAGDAGMCSPGCTKQNAGNFCGQNDVTWVCSPGYDSALFQAQCRDAATNAIRYCCPVAFMTNCQ
jgi:hypothetical protein